MAQLKRTTGTIVKSTATEISILDGDTSAISTTLVDADRVVINDAGLIKQVAVSDLKTYTGSGGGVQAGLKNYTPSTVVGSNAYTIPHASTDIVNVFLNGVLLTSPDGYSKDANASTVTLSADDASDEIVIQVVNSLSSTDFGTSVSVTRPAAVAGSNAYGISHAVSDLVLVYRNGILLSSADYTTSPSLGTVTFTCVDTSDEITIQVITVMSAYQGGMKRYTPVAVTGSNAYAAASNTGDIVNVFVNGVLLNDSDITITPGDDTITFSCVDTSDEIIIQVYSAMSAEKATSTSIYRPAAVAGSNAYSATHTASDTVLVYLNGILLNSSDYTTNSALNTITLFAQSGDDVVIQVISAMSTAYSGGITEYRPTTVVGSNAYSVTNTTGDIVNTFLNGVLLTPSDVTVDATNNRVTLTAEDSSDEIIIQVIGSLGPRPIEGIVRYTPSTVAGSNAYSVTHTGSDILNVFLNGILLNSSDYSSSAANNTITIISEDATDVIEIQVITADIRSFSPDHTFANLTATGTITTDNLTTTGTVRFQKGSFAQSPLTASLIMGT